MKNILLFLLSMSLLTSCAWTDMIKAYNAQDKEGTNYMEFVFYNDSKYEIKDIKLYMLDGSNPNNTIQNGKLVYTLNYLAARDSTQAIKYSLRKLSDTGTGYFGISYYNTNTRKTEYYEDFEGDLKYHNFDVDFNNGFGKKRTRECIFLKDYYTKPGYRNFLIAFRAIYVDGKPYKGNTVRGNPNISMLDK